MDLALLWAVDFHTSCGSGFSETFGLIPNPLGTSQSPSVLLREGRASCIIHQLQKPPGQ